MSENAVRAVRHARLRWVGAPLLLSGFGLLLFAIYSALTGGSLLTVGLGMFGCGLALASFGANHDTAMALAFSSRDEGLPDALNDELNEELERDRDAVVHGRPSPGVGLVVPFIAAGIQAWVAFRLFGSAL